MTEELDKEMDALLRQAARGETASVNSGFRIQDSGLPHLDADEISLFAENALPKNLRENAVVHFADCDRCRKILSDLIAQNTENEIVSAGQIEVFAPTIPWYRKLFAFPNLAYTLGALVLIFSGVIAFTVLKSVDESPNAEVSQVSEPTKGGPFADETAVAPEQNANTMTSGSMSNASASNAASTSSSGMTASNAATDSATRNSNASSVLNSSTVSNKSTVSKNDSPKDAASKDEARPETTVTQQLITELPLNGRNFNNLTEEKTEREKAKKESPRNDKNEAETTETAEAAPPPKPAAPSVSDNDAVSSNVLSAKSRKLSRTQSVETISVGGKNFKRSDNNWVDSAYKGQATTNIARGTKEFKKLYSDLRRIAENLGGTVIIVWKDKAYRIQ